MRRLFPAAIAALVMLVAPAFGDDIRKETVQFAKGASGATIDGSIKGRESVSYLLGAKAGQRMTVSLKADNDGTYFNVYGPGKGPGDEALAVGDLTGPMVPDVNRFDGALPQDGEYTISVYLVRSAARRGETSKYAIEVSIGAAGEPVAAQTPAGTGEREPDATGEIPCAQFVGQPMGSCPFAVVREGGGTATVTVTFPDGRTRAIFFDGGAAVSADTSQADGDAPFSASKEADLNMIRVGAERFEIPDAVIFGG